MRLLRLFRTILADMVVLLGLGALLYGVAQVSTPVAWILGGLALLGAGVRLAWLEPPRRR